MDLDTVNVIKDRKENGKIRSSRTNEVKRKSAILPSGIVTTHIFIRILTSHKIYFPAGMHQVCCNSTVHGKRT